jgi:hypothetical protein
LIAIMDRYKIWSPLPGLPAELACKDLRDDDNGLRITLNSPDDSAKLLAIDFLSVIAYRNVNESYRLRTWARTDIPRSSLLVVEESSWISWLRQEATGMLDHESLVHYAIHTQDDCIDVASGRLPVVRWIAG